MRTPGAKIALSFAIAVLGLVAAGCGGGGANAGAKADAGTITLGFWDGTFKPAYEKIVAAFERQHPEIHVKLQVTPAPQYWTKLQAAVQSGQAPDLFWMNEPNFQKYAAGDVLHPISDLMAASRFDARPFPGALMRSYAAGGRQYGLPWTAVTVGLWFNKSLFDAAGVQYPNARWTWADAESAAKRLTNRSKGVFGIGAALNNQENYYNTILQAGGSIVSPDGARSGWNTPEAIAGLRFWTDLIRQGASPSLQQMSDTAPDALFESGKLAMLYGGTWHAGTFAQTPLLKHAADVTVLPKGRVRATTVEGASYVMAKSSAHPEAAWRFMQFLVSRQAQLIQARSGVVVPARHDAQQAWVDSVPQYHLQSFVDELAYARPYPASKDTSKWQDKEPTVLAPAWSGKQDAAAAASAMGRLTDQALAEERR